MESTRGGILVRVLPFLILAASETLGASALGSMSSVAVSYGENGPVLCALLTDGSHLVRCFGTDASIVYGAPSRLAMLGLTAGDSFVCGLLLDSGQPYCWGSNVYVKIGVPQPIEEGAAYSEISAGDHHLCGIQKTSPNFQSRITTIDCWGYNMTASMKVYDEVTSITAGSLFNCGLFLRNRTAFCWGDETTSGIISLIPKNLRFRLISAGGFHVCGVLKNSRVFCWGRSLGMQGDVHLAPLDPMISVVGGKFHACGIRTLDHEVFCWGFRVQNSAFPPQSTKFYVIAAGDYFTCGVLADPSLAPICWGSGGPWSLPIAASPGVCESNPCRRGFFEFSHVSLLDKFCQPANSRVCLPCSHGCPPGTHQLNSCNATSDRSCERNCTSCASSECSSLCSQKLGTGKLSSLLLPIFLAELAFGLVLASSACFVACIYVRYRLQMCKCNATQPIAPKVRPHSFEKVRPEMEELRIRRAKMFTFDELEKATGGFGEASLIGKGSFSCVFKGVLKDGTLVAVKRAIGPSGSGGGKNVHSKEFDTELDLLSRLNHAHLLNLLGYCEEGGERLLVYEFMAHGSLYQHLHGGDGISGSKERLDWVRRVTIAVQAARGIEYLHGYACPPVIHRDIKSSNILIDEERNARVADFGLSLLGPDDRITPLSELPAGTLGYLDPEYYRLHYLTTKSDVYGFGVLLLEILSGRKAIDMRFEEGNIVEWAVPLIRGGNVSELLDPSLKPPAELEALAKIAAVAGKCVRMRGKDRPSMDEVTTALERALVLLMGSSFNDQPILPTEVVLGSIRLHKKASQRFSVASSSESVAGAEDQQLECRAPSWITFASTASSRRRKSSASEEDAAEDGGWPEGGNLKSLEEEIGPASPDEELFLKHNF